MMNKMSWLKNSILYDECISKIQRDLEDFDYLRDTARTYSEITRKFISNEDVYKAYKQVLNDLMETQNKYFKGII